MLIYAVSAVLTQIYCVVCTSYIPLFPTYETHECKRECNSSSKPKICYYNFTMEYHFTNTPMCQGCLNGTLEDCFTTECIVANGKFRQINVYNRMLPGPPIEVCWNDEIVVDLTNSLEQGATTLHWHGIHQRHTNHMDGVPMITQCPILPFMKFRYQFTAAQHGTRFYHSHLVEQRANGASGPLIVRRSVEEDTHAHLYDYDLSEHVIQVQDWSREDPFVIETALSRTYAFDGHQIDSLVINGFGPSEDNNVPAKIFKVKQGKRYRFRLINAATTSCVIQMKIQDHRITVISSDGYDLTPVAADSLLSSDGETFDFILEANRTVKSYVMTFEGSIICRKSSYAILQYEGADVGKHSFEDSTRKIGMSGVNINCANATMYPENCLSFSNLTAVKDIDERLLGKPDFQQITLLSLKAFVPQLMRGFHDWNLTTAMLDQITMITPDEPLLQNEHVDYCNQNRKQGCDKNATGCECLHIVKVPYGGLIEFIYVDQGGPGKQMSHIMHLHGYNFSVLGTGYLGPNSTREHVRNLDKQGLLNRNYKNPPIKDTVLIPVHGYAIIRFIADNDGYWFNHCHIEQHISDGMSLVIASRTTKKIKLPHGFPRCTSYMPEIIRPTDYSS